MNYLAHAYLSFDDPAILTGNMISDHVKGKKKFDLPVSVQQGIGLHRAIDAFTDSHAATKKAMTVFREPYRLYSAVFVDVIFDHFLATDRRIFSSDSLWAFSQRTYRQLEQYSVVFPAGFGAVFPSMKQYNWLYHYRERQGVARSFNGLVRRARFLSESDEAFGSSGYIMTSYRPVMKHSCRICRFLPGSNTG